METNQPFFGLLSCKSHSAKVAGIIQIRIYNPKEGNPSWGLSNSINFGVLEYWSVGLMTKGLMSFFQHSNTPSLQYSRAKIFKSFWRPLNYFFMGHSSVIYIQ